MSDGADRAGGPRSGDRPPPGGRWSVLYALVIAALFAEIGLLAWLTVGFR